MIRLGLVGGGFIAQAAHIPSVALLRDVEIVAVADLDEERARAAGRACGASAVYGSGIEMLDGEPDLDGVIVATPRSTHAEACVPLIERGVPVFLEKPLEAGRDGALQIVEAQERSGSPVLVGYHNRFDPAFAATEEILAEARFGALRYLSIRSFGGAWKAGATLPGQLDPDDTAPLTRPPQAQARDAVDHPPEVEWVEGWIHEVNMARALAGDATSVTYATTAMPRLAIVELARCRGLFEVGLISPPGFPFECILTLHLERARLEVSFAPPLLFRERSVLKVITHEAVTLPSLDYRESFVEELAHFVRCIKGSEEPRLTVREAYADLELCLQVAAKARDERLREERWSKEP